MKKILLSVAIAFAFFCAPLFAISNITITGQSSTRWNGAISASSVTTEGGNISAVNITTSQLTTKWASFYGNVSGTIILGSSSTSVVYTWTTTNSAGGEVCVSTSATYPFSLMSNTSAANIDSAFGTTGIPDDAASTFTTLCPPYINVGGSNNLTDYTAAQTQGSSTFFTCAANTSSGTDADNHAFCTAINGSGKNFDNVASDFELMVPTGASTRAYYFFMEFG